MMKVKVKSESATGANTPVRPTVPSKRDTSVDPTH